MKKEIIENRIKLPVYCLCGRRAINVYNPDKKDYKFACAVCGWIER